MSTADQRHSGHLAGTGRQRTIEEQNCAVVRRLWEEVWNAGNLDAIDELVDRDLVNLGEPVDGPAFIRDLVVSSRHAFPDGRFTVEHEVAQGEWVVHRVMRTGTFEASWRGFMDVAPTGRSFTARHIHMFRVRGSRVVEHWAARDDLGMLRQLAVLPETGNLSRIRLGRPGGGSSGVDAGPLDAPPPREEESSGAPRRI
jgi:predicted ester cyclase